MNVQQAIKELRALPPLSGISMVTPKEWERRQRLISVVEQATQDPEYIRERNSHLTMAEKYADVLTISPRGDEKYYPEWNRHFLARMETLMPIARRLAA